MKNSDYYEKTLKELYDINEKNNFDFYELNQRFNIFKSIKALKKCINFWDNYDFYYRNSKEFLEAKRYYDLVLEEISKMAKNLNWDNEMKLFSGYGYLLKQGYLSLEHQFYYSININDCRYLFGNSVIEGIGCCRNINGMLKDLLRKSEASSYQISMLLDKDTIFLNDMQLLSIDEGNKMANNARKSNLFTQLKERIYLKDRNLFNHTVTLFYDDIHSYIMDAANDTIYLVDDNLEVYQCDNKFDVCYRKWYNADENIKLNDILKSTSKEMLEDRLNDYYKVFNSCFELTDVFEKFYLEHKELYEEVVEKRKVLLREYNQYNIFNHK